MSRRVVEAVGCFQTTVVGNLTGWGLLMYAASISWLDEDARSVLADGSQR